MPTKAWVAYVAAMALLSAIGAVVFNLSISWPEVVRAIAHEDQMFTYSALVESADHIMVTVTVSGSDAGETWEAFLRECARVRSSNVLPPP